MDPAVPSPPPPRSPAPAVDHATPDSRSPVRSPVQPPVLSRANSREISYGGHSFPPIQNSHPQYSPYYPPAPAPGYSAPGRMNEQNGRYQEGVESYPGPAGTSAVELYQQRWEESQRGMYEQQQQERPEYREAYYQERMQGNGSSGSVSPEEQQQASEANRSPNEGYFYRSQSQSNQGQDVYEPNQPSPPLPLYYNYGPTPHQSQFAAQEAYANHQYAQYGYGPAPSLPAHPTPAPSYHDSNPVSRSGSLSDASSKDKGKAKAVVNTDDRPFACDECEHAFHRNHDLKRHKRIHLEIKPYPCDWCDKRFTRKDALKRHLLVKQHPVTQEDRDRETRKQATKANNKKLKKTAASLRGMGSTPATIRRELKDIRENPPTATPPRSASPAIHPGNAQFSPHAPHDPNNGIPLRYAPRDANLLSHPDENGSHDSAPRQDQYFADSNGRYHDPPQHHQHQQQSQGNFQPFAVAFV